MARRSPPPRHARRRPPTGEGPERLEPRFALAATTFTDVDGDIVTVTTSKGSNAELAAALTTIAQGSGFQLRRIDLTAASFAGTNLSVTARKVGPGGDGFVNVGEIAADGRDLGAVTVRGDLGRIRAGDATFATPALTAFTTWSLGRRGTTSGAPDLASLVFGSVGVLRINGDVVGASIGIIGPVVQKVIVTGSLIGAATDDSGSLRMSSQVVQSITIGGSIYGGDGLRSGAVDVAGRIGQLAIGGDVYGGAGLAGRIGAATIGTATIGGSLFGGGGGNSGSLEATAIGRVVVGGSVAGGFGAASGTILSQNSPAGIGSLTVGGDIVGGSAANSGRIASDGPILTVTVGGSILGGDGDNSGQIYTVGRVSTLRLAGDVRGAGGDDSGAIHLAENVPVGALGLGAAIVSGSVVGGDGTSSGRLFVRASAARMVVGGSVRGGDGGFSGVVRTDRDLGSISVGRSIIGGLGQSSGVIGSGFGHLGQVTVGGSLIGSVGASSGRVNSSAGAGVVVIRGSVLGGLGQASGRLQFLASARRVEIGGSIESGGGVDSGSISSATLKTLVVRGSIRGTVSRPVSIRMLASSAATPALGSVVVAGSVDRCLIRASVDGAVQQQDSRIGSVTIGGDMIATSIVSAATNQFGVFGNGSDVAEPNLVSGVGPVTVGGRILGSAGFETFGIVARSIGLVRAGGTLLTVPAAGSLSAVGSSNVYVHVLP